MSGCGVYGELDEISRLALVSVNQNYQMDVVDLENTLEDGRRMQTSLVDVGFIVLHCVDLSHDDMLIALDSFINELNVARDKTSDVTVVFYYSGHGVSLSNSDRAFLLPTDFSSQTLEQFEDKAIGLDLISNAISSANPRRQIQIFDACREELILPNQNTKGLVRQLWAVDGPDMMTAYPNSWGKLTRDDGIYSSVLARWITQPHLNVSYMFSRVRTDVGNNSHQERIPEYYARNMGDYSFFPSTQ